MNLKLRLRVFRRAESASLTLELPGVLIIIVWFLVWVLTPSRMSALIIEQWGPGYSTVVAPDRPPTTTRGQFAIAFVGMWPAHDHKARLDTVSCKTVTVIRFFI